MPRRFFNNHLFFHSCVDLSGNKAKSIDGIAGDVIAVGFSQCVEEEPSASGRSPDKTRSRSKESKPKEKKIKLKRSASDGYTKTRRVNPPKSNSSLKRSGSDAHRKSIRVKPRSEAKQAKQRKATVKRSASDGYTKSRRIKPLPPTEPPPPSVSTNGHVRVTERVKSTGYSVTPLDSSGSSEHSERPIIGREEGFIQSGSVSNDASASNGTPQSGNAVRTITPLIKVDHAPSRTDSVSNGTVKLQSLATSDPLQRARLLDTTRDTPTPCEASVPKLNVNGALPPVDLAAIMLGRANTLNVGSDSVDEKRHTACLSASKDIQPGEVLKTVRRKSGSTIAALPIDGELVKRGSKDDLDVHWKRKVSISGNCR